MQLNSKKILKTLNKIIYCNISFEQKRLFNCSCDRIYSTILDINNYKNFIPFVSNSVILKDKLLPFNNKLSVFKNISKHNSDAAEIRNLIGRLDVDFKLISTSY